MPETYLPVLTLKIVICTISLLVFLYNILTKNQKGKKIHYENYIIKDDGTIVYYKKINTKA